MGDIADGYIDEVERSDEFVAQVIRGGLNLEEDERRTGRIRCIGCGRFVSCRSRWNQCPDCDVREPEEISRCF